MQRAYYSDSIANFRNASPHEVLGKLTQGSEFDVVPAQRDAWLDEIAILQHTLAQFEGSIYFEYSIPLWTWFTLF